MASEEANANKEEKKPVVYTMKSSSGDSAVISKKEAIDLLNHDRHYHDGHYRGGKCVYRDKLFEIKSRGGEMDNSDRILLDEADKLEAFIHSGRRHEAKMVQEEFVSAFSTDDVKLWANVGVRMDMSEPDKEGVSVLTMTCGENVPNEMFPATKLKRFFKGIGYELKGAKVRIEKDAGSNKEKAKAKKKFTFSIYRPEKIEEAKQKDDYSISKEDRPLSEEERSAALKRYGMKSEGGKVVRRTEEDTRRDRIARAVGITGDWEGQSTKEDKDSGVWESRRIQALKRAQEALKEEAEQGRF